MSGAWGVLAVMGKLGSRAEYVGINAGTPRVVGFDQWVTDGMGAPGTGREGWTPSYDAGAAHAFVYAPDGGCTFLAGAIAPSADSAGRRYPFFAAREVEFEDAASPEFLPLALEEVWDEATRVVSRATREGAPPLPEVLGSRHGAPPEDLPRAVASFDQWTHGMQLGELAELLFGEPSAAPAFEAGLSVLFQMLSSHRGVEPPRTRFALDLPLGRVGGAAVCFWLAVVRRVLGWTCTVPSFFWTHDGHAGRLLLYPGPPPTSAFGQIWMPRPADDVLVLTAATTEESPRRAAVAAAGGAVRAFARNDATVHDLLLSL